MADISRPDVQAWANTLAETFKPGTARQIFNVFASSLSGVVEANIIDSNPATRIKLPPAPRGREVFLAREEFADMLAHIPDANDAAVVQFLVGTGMRWGELAGRHWHNLDLESGMVTLADVSEWSGIKPYPKRRRVRCVPSFPWAVENISTDNQNTPCTEQHAEGPCRSGLLFRTRPGGLLSDRNYGSRTLRNNRSYRPAA